MSDPQPPTLFETTPGSSRGDVAATPSFLAELNPQQLEAVTYRVVIVWSLPALVLVRLAF